MAETKYKFLQDNTLDLEGIKRHIANPKIEGDFESSFIFSYKRDSNSALEEFSLPSLDNLDSLKIAECYYFLGVPAEILINILVELELDEKSI